MAWSASWLWEVAGSADLQMRSSKSSQEGLMAGRACREAQVPRSRCGGWSGVGSVGGESRILAQNQEFGPITNHSDSSLAITYLSGTVGRI